MTRAFGGLSLSDRCMSSTVAVGQLSVWGRRKFASFDSGTSDGSSLDHLPPPSFHSYVVVSSRFMGCLRW